MQVSIINAKFDVRFFTIKSNYSPHLRFSPDANQSEKHSRHTIYIYTQGKSSVFDKPPLNILFH